MTKTIFGGMDDEWAAKMDMPAQRFTVLLSDFTGINQIRAVKNIIVLAYNRRSLCRDINWWATRVDQLCKQCKGYNVEFVVENEACQLIGYKPDLYCALWKATADTAKPYGIRAWNSGLLMPQATRMCGEKITDKTQYRAFAQLAQSYGIWGRIERARSGEYECDFAQKNGLPLNFHFQQFYDVLQPVIDYLLSKGLPVMNNEFSWRGGTYDIIEKLIDAVKGKLEIVIWDNMLGFSAQIVPLDEPGEKVLMQAIAY